MHCVGRRGKRCAFVVELQRSTRSAGRIVRHSRRIDESRRTLEARFDHLQRTRDNGTDRSGNALRLHVWDDIWLIYGYTWNQWRRSRYTMYMLIIPIRDNIGNTTNASSMRHSIFLSTTTDMNHNAQCAECVCVFVLVASLCHLLHS